MKTPAEKTIVQAMGTYGMISAGDRVLCALSGGGDSVCMTHFLSLWGRQNGVTVAAAHFTHGLRPAAARAERELAEALCSRLKIQFFTQEGDTASFAAQNKLGTEEAARRLRYQFLHRVAQEWNAQKIATGHNQGDQAETVLFNLIRGAGAGGMKGIPPVNGMVVRPLICTSRGQIDAYLAHYGLDWAEDASNSQTEYTRNRLRLEILPLLEQINPKAGEHIAQGGLRLGQDAEYMDRQAAALFAEAGLSVEKLAWAHPAVGGRAILAAWRKRGLGGELGAPHIQGILDICRGSNPSAAISLPGGIARREYGMLYFEPSEERVIPSPLSLMPGQSVRWGAWMVEARWDGGQGGWPFLHDGLTLPLTVRSRLPGDQIFMHGQNKKVKKLMIDRKIPQKFRDIIPIVCDNNGVLCIGGIGCDSARAGAQPGEKVIHLLCKKACGAGTQQQE